MDRHECARSGMVRTLFPPIVAVAPTACTAQSPRAA